MTPDDYLKIEGVKAHKSANDLFHNKKIKTEEVLRLYDKAVENGVVQAIGDRAYCLQALGYHFDAISDFTEAISFDAYDSSLYFARASSKKSIDDLEGSIDDLKKAVYLGSLITQQNKNLDDKARKMGWDTVVSMYEYYLSLDQKELEFNKENPEVFERLKSLTIIKKRKTTD